MGTQSVFAEYQRYHNPWLMVEKWTRGHYKNDTYAYLTGNYKIDDHLSATLRTQISTYDLLRTEKMPFSAHPYGREGNLGDYREDRRNLFDNNTEGFLNFNYDLGQTKFLNLSGLVGGNVRNMTYNSNWTSTDYLNVPEVYAFSNSLNPVQSTSFSSQMRVLSAYYSLDASLGRYATLSTTGRIDRSSAFQTPTTYYYPSASLATVVSDYLPVPTVISFLKLRGSYCQHPHRRYVAHHRAGAVQLYHRLWWQHGQLALHQPPGLWQYLPLALQRARLLAGLVLFDQQALQQPDGRLRH